MRNFLREDLLTAAAIKDKYQCNLEGGVALWDTPPTFSRAFNPITFTRTRYLFVTDGFAPTREPRPNIVGVKPGTKRTLQLTYPAAAYIYVQVTNASGNIRTVLFSAGVREATASGDVVSIDGFKRNPSEPIRRQYVDHGFVFLVPGEAYEDEHYIVAPGDAATVDNYLDASRMSVLYVVDEVDTSYLDVYRSDGTMGAKLSAESFRGVTTFDVSAVVRLWFNRQLADSTPGAERPTAQSPDGRLFARFTVRGLGGPGTKYEFMALNAVAQIGENSDMGPYRGQLLSELRRLRQYEGYPLDYSVLDERDIEYSDGVIRLPIPGDGESRADGYGVAVIPSCTPAQPFYVRWVNRLGGVEYFMFGRRQTRKASVKSVSTYGLYVPDSFGASTNRRAYALTTDNTVTVGADGVPEAEYAVLSELPFAPTIEWYAETDSAAGGRWVELTVSKFDGSLDTSSRTHSIEIVFQLPNLNVQF